MINMILKSKSVRKFNKDLKLVEELYNDEYKYTIKYDDKGNIIYNKKIYLPNNFIEYEYEDLYSKNGLLIYRNRIDIGVKEYYIYNDKDLLIRIDYENHEELSKKIIEYDNFNQTIKEVYYDNNDIIIEEIEYENIYELD